MLQKTTNLNALSEQELKAMPLAKYNTSDDISLDELVQDLRVLNAISLKGKPNNYSPSNNLLVQRAEIEVYLDEQQIKHQKELAKHIDGDVIIQNLNRDTVHIVAKYKLSDFQQDRAVVLRTDLTDDEKIALVGWPAVRDFNRAVKKREQIKAGTYNPVSRKLKQQEIEQTEQLERENQAQQIEIPNEIKGKNAIRRHVPNLIGEMKPVNTVNTANALPEVEPQIEIHSENTEFAGIPIAQNVEVAPKPCKAAKRLEQKAEQAKPKRERRKKVEEVPSQFIQVEPVQYDVGSLKERYAKQLIQGKGFLKENKPYFVPFVPQNALLDLMVALQIPPRLLYQRVTNWRTMNEISRKQQKFHQYAKQLELKYARK